MTDMRGAEDAAPGVKALIDRLRGEGVASGRAEAERLIAEARQQAQEIVARAEHKAGQLVDQAQKETESSRPPARPRSRWRRGTPCSACARSSRAASATRSGG